MNIILPGVMRCGTTSLRTCLSRHPDIAPPKRREIEYFSSGYDKGAMWYRLQLGKGGLDKSPNYMADPDAAPRIFRDLPHAKIVMLFRDPVDRAWSHYRWLRQVKREKRSFRQVLGSPSRRGWYSVLDRGKYAEQLSHWLGYIHRESILVIQSEEFFTRTVIVYDQIIDWLGLPKYPLYKPRKHGTVQSIGEMPKEDRQFLLDYYKPHNEALWQLLHEDWNWQGRA